MNIFSMIFRGLPILIKNVPQLEIRCWELEHRIYKLEHPELAEKIEEQEKEMPGWVRRWFESMGVKGEGD